MKLPLNTNKIIHKKRELKGAVKQCCEISQQKQKMFFLYKKYQCFCRLPANYPNQIFFLLYFCVWIILSDIRHIK